jgi:hypothetical protein
MRPFEYRRPRHLAGFEDDEPLPALMQVGRGGQADRPGADHDHR